MAKIYQKTSRNSTHLEENIKTKKISLNKEIK